MVKVSLQYGTQATTNIPNMVMVVHSTISVMLMDIIYLEVDLSCPVCADCDSTSLDGYTGATINSEQLILLSQLNLQNYKELEFEDKIGEVSFDLRVCNSFCN